MTDGGHSVPAPRVQVIRRPDPVSRALGFAILFVLITALTGILYFVLTGVIDPPAPRTAVETQALLLEQAVKTSPKSGSAWSDYIKTVTQMGDYNRASGLVKRARASVSGDQRIVVDLAALNLLMFEKEYKAADKLADDILEQDKADRARALAELASKGVFMKPTEVGVDVAVQARLGKARVSAKLGHWDVAVKMLTEALDFSPNNSDLYALRGQARFELKQDAQAAKDFKTALKYDPQNKLALQGLKKAGE